MLLEDTYRDEYQDCVDDVEESEGSRLVLCGCFFRHLPLEPDSEADETENEDFLETDAAHVDVKTWVRGQIVRLSVLERGP